MSFNISDMAVALERPAPGFPDALMLAALPVAWIACDAEGLVVSFNEAAGRLFEGTLVAGSAVEDGLRLDRGVAAPGRAVRGVVEAGGSTVAVSVQTQPLHGEDGKVIGAILCLSEESRPSERPGFVELVVETTPECVKVVDAEGLVQQMNAAGLRMMEASSPSAVIGEPVLDLIAPEFRDAWWQQHQRVCDGESLSWSFDVIGLKGTRRHMETHAVPIRMPDGASAQLAITRDVTIRRRQEAALLQRERWFRGLLDALPMAVYTTDADGRLTYYNSAAAEFWGHEPQLFTSLWCGSWKLFAADGTPIQHDQCPMALAIKERRPIRNVEAQAERPDGTRIPFMPYPTPLFDEDGTLLGAVNMLVDISPHKAAAAHQQLMINELNHRVKNTLVTVQSIAAQTLRDQMDPAAQARLQSRILALSRAHDVLTHEQWERAGLEQIVRLAVAPLQPGESGRVSVSGPPVELPPKMALSLAMACHELLTNALKYGSLSVSEGVVEVAWHTLRRAEGERLQLTWKERNGPPVAPPLTKGFGSRLIERGLAHELQAAIALEFRSDGLVCTIDAPLDAAGQGTQ